MKIVAAVAAMISGQTAAYPAVAPPGSPIGGRAGVVYVIVEAFDVVELVLISVDGAFVGDGTVVVCFHIHDVVVARMVHNDIHYYADTVSVSGVYQRLELCLCTEVSVGLGVVEHIVAVVGIVSKVTVAGVNIAVDLLVGSGERRQELCRRSGRLRCRRLQNGRSKESRRWRYPKRNRRHFLFCCTLSKQIQRSQRMLW